MSEAAADTERKGLPEPDTDGTQEFDAASDAELDEVFGPPVHGAEEAQEPPEDPETGEPPLEAPEELQEPQGASDIDFEKNMGKTEKEGERHRKRLAEIWGDEDVLHWHVCPGCQPFAGMRPPMPWDDEEKNAVRAFIGDGSPQEYADDPETVTCDVCGGLGLLQTGSKMPNMATRPCRKCEGSGYTTAEGEPPSRLGLAARPATEPNGGAPPPVPEIRDKWGRAPSDPAFGQDPNFVPA